MRNNLLLVLFCCLLFRQAFGQSNNTMPVSGKIQPLAIGDKVPEIKVGKVINYPADHFILSDSPGKLFILDFWATNCYSCILAFSKLDSLQRMFGNKIQILAINPESEDSTVLFLKKHKMLKKYSFPFITSDTLLAKYFPHQFVPHHIWIDNTMKVKFITSSSNTTYENIEDVLKGKEISLREKKEILDFDYTKPLISEGNGRWLNKIECYSYISSFIPDLWLPNINFAISDGSIRNLLTGSIFELIVKAFEENGKYNFNARNSIQLDVADPNKFYPPNNKNDLDNWIAQHCYTYELLIPQSKNGEVFKIMQEDLTRYFDIEARIEKRKIDCLAVIRITKDDKLISTPEKSKKILDEMKTDSLWGIRNQPFIYLIKGLNRMLNRNIPQPIIDQTGYKGNVDIGITIAAISTFDVSAIKKELHKYGLDLIEEEVFTDVLIIKEK